MPAARLGQELFAQRMSRSARILDPEGSETAGTAQLAGAHLGIEPVPGWSFGVNRVIQYGGGAAGGSSFHSLIDALVHPSSAKIPRGPVIICWATHRSRWASTCFVDLGASVNRLKTDLAPEQVATWQPFSSPHVGFGARRAVTDHSDRGVRGELDRRAVASATSVGSERGCSIRRFDCARSSTSERPGQHPTGQLLHARFDQCLSELALVASSAPTCFLTLSGVMTTSRVTRTSG